MGLTSLKVERHVLSNDPANDDKERSDKESDLDTGPDRDAHSKIHLVADSHDNSRDVLGRVTNDGDEDQTDEGLADARVLHQVVDTSHEVFGADRHENRSDNQHTSGSDGANGRFLHFVLLLNNRLVLGIFAGLGLGIEQVAVGSQLENEIQNV